MKYLVELVFGIGFFGLGAIALTFFMRFLLLTWAVRLAGRIIQSILGFVKRLCHALIFIFGPALLGGLIIGTSLQSGASLTDGGGRTSDDPTQSVLLGFLGFFVIVAFRAWQWNSRRKRASLGLPEAKSSTRKTPANDLMADAWTRAVVLAPAQRDEMLEARVACSTLLTAVKSGDGEPDAAMIETAQLIRDHLAALIDSTERRLRRGTTDKSDATITEMVYYLLAFGDRARRDLLATAAKIDARDAAMRAHLEAKLFQ